MNKQEFLDGLKAALSAVPSDDLDERLDFISEIIDDKIEEGMSEEEAVGEVGTIDDVSKRILSEVPFSKLIKEKVKQKTGEKSLFKSKTAAIVLIIVGSPIWLSLLIALFAALLSFVIVLWSLAIALYCVDAAFAASSLVCVVLCVLHAAGANIGGLVLTVGCTMICIGCAVLLFFASISTNKAMVRLMKIIIIKIKSKI